MQTRVKYNSKAHVKQEKRKKVRRKGNKKMIDSMKHLGLQKLS